MWSFPHIAVVFGGACGHILPGKESKEIWYLRAKPEYDLTIWWVISKFISQPELEGGGLVEEENQQLFTDLVASSLPVIVQ